MSSADPGQTDLMDEMVSLGRNQEFGVYGKRISSMIILRENRMKEVIYDGQLKGSTVRGSGPSVVSIEPERTSAAHRVDNYGNAPHQLQMLLTVYLPV